MRPLNPDSIESIFGERGRLYVSVASSLEEDDPDCNYEFISEDYAREVAEATHRVSRGEEEANFAEANYRFSKDQLSKAHIVAYTSILRTMRWIRGMLASYEGENALVFAASFRSLLEATADAFDALRDIPLNIANNYPTYYAALTGDIDDEVWVCPELEELLDHYHWATDPRNNPPEGLEAKSSRTYLNALEEAGVDQIHDCYSDLCELTHPAVPTVRNFVEADEQGVTRLSLGGDSSFIEELCNQYQEVLDSATQISINPALMTLKVLNLLPIDDLNTDSVSDVDLDASSEWREMRDNIREFLDHTL